MAQAVGQHGALAEQLAQPFPQFRPDVAEQQIRP